MAAARLEGLGGTFNALLSQVVLQLRIYALFDKSRRILAVLILSMSMTAVTSFALMIDILSTIDFVASSLSGISGRFCKVRRLPRSFREFLIPLLAHELFLFCLAAWKGYQCYRDKSSGSRITMRLLRGSLLYFFFSVFFSYLWSELVWTIGSDDDRLSAEVNLVLIPIGIVITINSVMSQRLLISTWESCKMAATAGGEGYALEGRWMTNEMEDGQIVTFPVFTTAIHIEDGSEI